MQLITHPPREQWPELCQRPAPDWGKLEKQVEKILLAVQRKGDRAVKKFTREWDQCSLRKLRVSDKEMKEALKALEPALQEALQLAYGNIERFHTRQPFLPQVIETQPGVKCWRKQVPIEKVGLYIPGGSAPLFSTVLMLGIPARIAGCREIILCTPPRKDGSVHPAILYAASLVGVTQLFKCGGAQSIGAMAFGTESIPKVDKIFGPGNLYVTLAKQSVQKEGVAIDLPAGPSEVAILADESADPRYLAADLLSQAEHGPDSQVVLVTPSEKLVHKVQAELSTSLQQLPRSAVAASSLQNSMAFVVDSLEEGMDLLNEYAPEHLILNCQEARMLAEKVKHAGSVFIGPYSPESAGDYASGTNHTLPTRAYAKAYSGVNVESFLKTITFQELTSEGLALIGPAVVVMAEAEGLKAHANAIRVRLEKKS